MIINTKTHNVLYELYLKEELRKDRLFKRISLEQVDIKLKIASLCCIVGSKQKLSISESLV